MSSTVQTIKDRLSVVEVLGNYLKLEKAGANFKAKCPFHNEKTASFFISSARNTYYCFGCGSKGDIFSFVQEFEGLDFPGALKMLAQRAGVEIVHENPKTKSDREQSYSILEHATLFFQKKLAGSEEALKYLKKRGLKIETVREWRLGFAPLEWRSLSAYLKEKNFTDSEMEKAGLTKRVEESGGASKDGYDRFRGRVMFPIFDSSGRVIAFSGRILVDDEKAPKYLNSPDSPLFNKSQVLYGLDKAKLEIKKHDSSILVEGQMDLLMSHQAGFGNTLAVSGTALTKDHLTLLHRFSDKTIMAFDSDKAGENAAIRSTEIALAMGMEVRIVDIEGGKDPADLILSDVELWRKALLGAKHVIDFTLGRVLKEKHDERGLGKEIGKRVLPYVALIDSSIEQSHFIKTISQSTAIAESALWEDLKKISKALNTPNVSVQRTEEKVKPDSLAEKMIGLYYWQAGKETPDVAPEKIEKDVRFIIGEEGWNDLIKKTADRKDAMIYEAEMYYASSEKLLENIEETFLRFEEDFLKMELQRSIKNLHEAERTKDPEVARQILEKCTKISERLQSLAKKK